MNKKEIGAIIRWALNIHFSFFIENNIPKSPVKIMDTKARSPVILKFDPLIAMIICVNADNVVNTPKILCFDATNLTNDKFVYFVAIFIAASIAKIYDIELFCQ